MSIPSDEKFVLEASFSPPFASPSECGCPPQCTKDRILRAAQNLFYRHGIRAVSVDAIAAEAATTKVTLYRVFSSKDELVAQCLQDQTRRFWQWWDEAIAPHEGNPRAQIDALIASLECQVCTKEGDRGCPISNTAVEVVDTDHPAKQIIHTHGEEIARRFRALCKGMGARRPDELGDALTLLVTGVFSARIIFDTTVQVSAVGDAARALLESPTLGVPATTKRKKAS